MYCTECGQKNLNAAKFCLKCGNKFDFGEYKKENSNYYDDGNIINEENRREKKKTLLVSIIFIFAIASAVFVWFQFGYSKTGQVAIAPQFDPIVKDNKIIPRFHEGMAQVLVGKKYGYIDKTGIIVIQPQFGEASDFSEGRAKVRMEANFYSKIGFIDKSGNLVIPLQYEVADSFSEGLAAVRIGNSKYGFIDKEGKTVIPPQFDSAKSFSEGLAVITDT